MFTETSSQFDANSLRHPGSNASASEDAIPLENELQIAATDLTRTAACTLSWDVLVIGAGPAGSTAAITASRAGLRTLLVDRATFPRYKVCGCCLSPGGVAALKALWNGAPLPSAILDAATISGVMLHIGTRRWGVATDVGLVVGRHVLDHALMIEAMREGTYVLNDTSASVTALGRITTVQLHSRGVVREVRAACVIVADGLQGRSLDRFSEFKPRILSNGRIGIGCSFSHHSDLQAAAHSRRLNTLTATDRVAMAIARHGYVGFVRLGTGEVHCAAALNPKWAKECGGPARAVAALCSSCSLPGPPITAKWHGTSILTRVRPRIESHGLLVVGDAARYGEPFTGEGMTWALRGGQLAGDQAVFIAKRTYRKGDWTRQWQSTVAPQMQRSTLLSCALRWPRVLSAALDVAHLHSGLSASLARLAGPWGMRTNRRGEVQIANLEDGLSQ